MSCDITRNGYGRFLSGTRFAVSAEDALRGGRVSPLLHRLYDVDGNFVAAVSSDIAAESIDGGIHDDLLDRPIDAFVVDDLPPKVSVRYNFLDRISCIVRNSYMWPSWPLPVLRVVV